MNRMRHSLSAVEAMNETGAGINSDHDSDKHL
jgi:hypothetical protein